jgi:uncharacterized protein YbjQ (UPF0145 family)
VADADPSELERVRAESLQRLADGLLPVEAERRMRALRDRDNFFTSDLSVNEFALVADCGLKPVSQVMGSCVYHASMRANQAYAGWDPGRICSETLLARPYNEARRKALDRMTLEARECGADAVVGVRVSRGEGDYDPNSVEFVAIGTAVRIDGRAEHGSPILTGLSGGDYWRLMASGFWPVGLVAGTEVVSCIPHVVTQQGQSFGRLSTAGRQNRELEEFSAAIRAGISGATRELARQAELMGAEGVVGVTVDRHQMLVERENPDYGAVMGPQGQYLGGGRSAGTPRSREDLVVIVHALGTAIVAGQRPDRSEPPGLTITPVRRLDNNRRNAR